VFLDFRRVLIRAIQTVEAISRFWKSSHKRTGSDAAATFPNIASELYLLDPAMFRRIFSSLRTEPLKNTGSVARDLLASERTFLAWARSGLGFIALGVALEKVEAFASISPQLLQLENSNTKVAAAVLVGSGSLCVAHGTHSYFSTMRLLQQGLFRPNVVGVSLMAATCVGVAFAGTLLVLENEGGRRAKRIEQSRRE
jgi:uncharacterized membrane protein YidH (DUF202 family)